MIFDSSSVPVNAWGGTVPNNQPTSKQCTTSSTNTTMTCCCSFRGQDAESLSRKGIYGRPTRAELHSDKWAKLLLRQLLSLFTFSRVLNWSVGHFSTIQTSFSNPDCVVDESRLSSFTSQLCKQSCKLMAREKPRSLSRIRGWTNWLFQELIQHCLFNQIIHPDKQIIGWQRHEGKTRTQSDLGWKWNSVSWVKSQKICCGITFKLSSNWNTLNKLGQGLLTLFPLVVTALWLG